MKKVNHAAVAIKAALTRAGVRGGDFTFYDPRKYGFQSVKVTARADLSERQLANIKKELEGKGFEVKKVCNTGATRGIYGSLFYAGVRVIYRPKQ